MKKVLYFPNRMRYLDDSWLENAKYMNVFAILRNISLFRNQIKKIFTSVVSHLKCRARFLMDFH